MGIPKEVPHGRRHDLDRGRLTDLKWASKYGELTHESPELEHTLDQLRSELEQLTQSESFGTDTHYSASLKWHICIISAELARKKMMAAQRLPKAVE